MFRCKVCGRKINKHYYYKSGLCRPCYFSGGKARSVIKKRRLYYKFRGLLGGLITAVFVVGIVLLFVFPAAFGLFSDQDAEKAIFDLTNKERVNYNLRPLILDETLSEVARNHAKDMCDRSYFEHVNPEGDTPSDRACKAGFCSGIGENIAQWDSSLFSKLLQNFDFVGVVAGWMNSPGHKYNILSHSYSRIGIGVYTCIMGTYYVQAFA